MNRRLPLAVLLAAAALAVFADSSPCRAAALDEMSLDRWKLLREVERYQLNIAEKYYREKKWDVAAAEYEKYLTLYERSDAASYSQLKWSLCQRNVRKLNTAITDGFQSILDYWPDSPEAIAAGYYIGRCYKDMGEIRKAKKAYNEDIGQHPDHVAAAYAINDLIDVTTIEKDVDSRVRLWRKLVFETKRVRETQRLCEDASRSLASHCFSTVAFDDGVKSLVTTYDETQLPGQVVAYVHGPLRTLVADAETQASGEKLADLAIGWVRARIPEVDGTDESEQAARSYWYWIADLESSARRDPNVLETFGQIEKKFGGDDETLLRLGHWYKSRGKYEDARKTFGRFENKIAGNEQIAVSYAQQGQYEPAVEAYRRNVALDSENAAKWTNAVASTYRAAKKYAEAVAVYQELLQSDVENTQNWMWQIATTHREWGKYKEAIGFYRQCSNFPSNYWEMARCHRALKQYGEAVILYNQIIGGEPSQAPQALLQVAYTYEDAKQKEKAIGVFQQVCKRFPKAGQASTAHAHLQTVYKINVTLGGAKDE